MTKKHLGVERGEIGGVLPLEPNTKVGDVITLPNYDGVYRVTAIHRAAKQMYIVRIKESES